MCHTLPAQADVAGDELNNNADAPLEDEAEESEFTSAEVLEQLI